MCIYILLEWITKTKWKKEIPLRKWFIDYQEYIRELKCFKLLTAKEMKKKSFYRHVLIKQNIRKGRRWKKKIAEKNLESNGSGSSTSTISFCSK
jgi:hypothetical protein